MPDRYADVRLDADARAAEPDARPLAERPFTLALLGDFSGRGDAAPRPDLAGLRPLGVDRDDFDAVLARLAPQLRLRPDGAAQPPDVSFRDLDDFHPDQLFARLPLFQELRLLRRRLADPASFRQAAAELTPPAEPTAPAPAATTTTLSGGELLELMLGEAPPAVPPAPAAAEAADLRAYVRRLVAPHRVAGPEPGQAELLARLDAALGEQMRALLHHPAFQALEALWRATFLLVRRVETGPSLRIYLLDVTRAELQADLAPGRELHESALYRLLVEAARETPGGTPWSLLAGDYRFGPAEDDLRLLGRLAELAERAGAPFLAAAAPELIGCPSFAALPEPAGWAEPDAAWQALRREPAARWLGLAAPRLLLRLPYGEDAEPCESFRFEELPGPPRHDDYLWGSPAFACALLLAQSFAAAGWAMRPGMLREIERLPLHLARDADGDTRAQPCAETLLTERAAQRILDAGVMPLASRKEQDAVHLVRFQSVASPPAALAGPWTRPRSVEA